MPYFKFNIFLFFLLSTNIAHSNSPIKIEKPNVNSSNISKAIRKTSSVACNIRDPLKYHLSKTAEGRIDLPVQIKVNLNNDGLIDILQSAKDQCGYGGCEYTILLNLGSNCYKDIGEARGRLKVQPEIENGFHNLEFSTRGDALSEPTRQILKYSSQTEKYEETF